MSHASAGPAGVWGGWSIGAKLGLMSLTVTPSHHITNILNYSHDYLGLMIGCFSFDELVNQDNSSEYKILKILPFQSPNFKVDLTNPYKIISLYSDMLFSMKNQILEMTLNKSDFQFLTTTNYDVKPTFFINLPSKAVQIERERNIEYCELYFLNIFGEKIRFKSSTIIGQISFSI